MMERRSWPWKKKPEKAAATSSSATTLSTTGENQDGNNTINCVQISAEDYAHHQELENQLKILTEKLSAAETEITNKDNLVKQHTKVAEEAISGWEKAEAESSALKSQLESVTLSKLTVEERASHLDSALKECMKQIRNVKEESEQKLHDVVFTKTKQWEKIKVDLESKLTDFEKELVRASAENDALSISLQERSDILMKVSNEKMQADSEIEVLKSNIHSCEKEINSLKYELHVISKEMEIRNEEKNMCVKSADAANKQHLEDVKKISKLEAECQRLRGLVRKKLPGPAALAQMKLEVENLGRDPGDNRFWRSPARNPSPRRISSAAPDFAFASMHTLQKENEFLTARLFAIEEETNMLKEALTKRNSELQSTRNMFAKTASKLHSVEAQMLAVNRRKISFDTTLSQNESNPRSLTAMSEDGIDEDRSYSESLITALMPDLSQFTVEKDTGRHKHSDNSNHLELMDDFLEMEKLACLTTQSCKSVTTANSDDELDKTKTKNTDAIILGDVEEADASKKELMSENSVSLHCFDQKNSKGELTMNELNSLLTTLQSRIVSTFKLQDQKSDISRLLEDIRRIVQDTQDDLLQHSVSCVIEENCSIDASCHKNLCHDDIIGTKNICIACVQDSSSCTDDRHAFHQDIQNAISEIQNFVIYLGKETTEPLDRSSNVRGLGERIQQFSSYVKDVLHSEKSLTDFILVLSQILSEASELGLKVIFSMNNEWENNTTDCVDKVTLLENRVTQKEPRNEHISGRSMDLIQSSSYPEIEGHICGNLEQKNTMHPLLLKESEQMRLEKENLQIELSTCTELLEETKLRFTEMEQKLVELKSELDASQKSNSLAETQLKCMANSYNLLESHSKELEAELNLLRIEVQALNNKLKEERHIHEENLVQLRYLQEQIERNEKSSISTEADVGAKAKQNKEMADAAEKLAECQETILMLGRQLQALGPTAEQLDSLPNSRHLMIDEDAPGLGGFNKSMNNTVSEITSAPRTPGERLSDSYNSEITPSEAEAIPFPRSPISPIHQKHRLNGSSSSPIERPEKHGRGFSRFFSKEKK